MHVSDVECVSFPSPPVANLIEFKGNLSDVFLEVPWESLIYEPLLPRSIPVPVQEFSQGELVLVIDGVISNGFCVRILDSRGFDIFKLALDLDMETMRLSNDFTASPKDIWLPIHDEEPFYFKIAFDPSKDLFTITDHMSNEYFFDTLPGTVYADFLTEAIVENAASAPIGVFGFIPSEGYDHTGPVNSRLTYGCTNDDYVFSHDANGPNWLQMRCSENGKFTSPFFGVDWPACETIDGLICDNCTTLGKYHFVFNHIQASWNNKIVFVFINSSFFARTRENVSCDGISGPI